MNRNLIYFVFILLILFGCRQPKKNISPSRKPSDIAVITTLAFNATIPSDTLVRKSLLEMIQLEDSVNNSKPDQDNYNLKRRMSLDSQKRILDTAKIYAIVLDTLFKVSPAYLTSLLMHLKEEKNDSSNRLYYIFLSKWAPEIIINSQPGKFDMENLAFNYGYQYRLKSQIKASRNDIIGEGFQMSPVFFNKSKDKAFVSTEREHRYTLDLFFEKKSGRWQIIKNEMVSIY